MSGFLAASGAQASVPGSIGEIEEAFVAVHALWRRSPGGGRWPYAGDGPWHLAQGEVGDIKGEYSETLIRTEAGKELQVRKIDAREPRTPLSAAEVDERDRVTGWLQSVQDDALRRCIWEASAALARGEGRVPWRAIALWLRWERTPNALKARYRLALGELVCRLNGWPMRRARVLAAR